jgi:hypothetical protein
MTQEGSSAAQSAYYWVVFLKKSDEIEVWSTQEKAEASLASRTGEELGSTYLYHVADSEMKRAFPNMTVIGGDVEVDTTNKYIKKGWKPGMRK